MRRRLVAVGRLAAAVCRRLFWLLILVACVTVLYQQSQLARLTRDVASARSAARDAADYAQQAASAAEDALAAAADASSYAQLSYFR